MDELKKSYLDKKLTFGQKFNEIVDYVNQTLISGSYFLLDGSFKHTEYLRQLNSYDKFLNEEYGSLAANDIGHIQQDDTREVIGSNLVYDETKLRALKLHLYFVESLKKLSEHIDSYLIGFSTPGSYDEFISGVEDSETLREVEVFLTSVEREKILFFHLNYRLTYFDFFPNKIKHPSDFINRIKKKFSDIKSNIPLKNCLLKKIEFFVVKYELYYEFLDYYEDIFFNKTPVQIDRAVASVKLNSFNDKGFEDLFELFYTDTKGKLSSAAGNSSIDLVEDKRRICFYDVVKMRRHRVNEHDKSTSRAIDEHYFLLKSKFNATELERFVLFQSRINYNYCVNTYFATKIDMASSYGDFRMLKSLYLDIKSFQKDNGIKNYFSDLKYLEMEIKKIRHLLDQPDHVDVVGLKAEIKSLRDEVFKFKMEYPDSNSFTHYSLHAESGFCFLPMLDDVNIFVFSSFLVKNAYSTFENRLKILSLELNSTEIHLEAIGIVNSRINGVRDDIANRVNVAFQGKEVKLLEILTFLITVLGVAGSLVFNMSASEINIVDKLLFSLALSNSFSFLLLAMNLIIKGDGTSKFIQGIKYFLAGSVIFWILVLIVN